MIVVDTSVWIDYFNGIHNASADKLHELLSRQVLSVGDLIYCEVLQGFRSDAAFDAARNALDTLHKVEMLGFIAARRAAERYRVLRKKGVTIAKANDMLIASACIDLGAELLHNDGDFDLIGRHLPLVIVKCM